MCSFKGFCQKCLDRGERHVYLRRAKSQDKRMLCAFDGKIRDIGSGLLKRRSESFGVLAAGCGIVCAVHKECRRSLCSHVRYADSSQVTQGISLRSLNRDRRWQ